MNFKEHHVTALKFHGEKEQGAEGRISLDGSNYLSSPGLLALLPEINGINPVWEARGGSVLMGTCSWYSIKAFFPCCVGVIDLWALQKGWDWINSPKLFQGEAEVGDTPCQLGQEKLCRTEEYCQISKSHFTHLNSPSASPWLWSCFKSWFHRIDKNPVTFFTPRCCEVLPLWTSCWSSSSVPCPASPAWLTWP